MRQLRPFAVIDDIADMDAIYKLLCFVELSLGSKRRILL